jgi:synaptosomal-associated protein 29
MSSRNQQSRQNKWGAAAEAAEKGGPTRWQDDDRNNDIEWLQEETRKTQQESVQSSRRALRRLNETQEMAENSLQMVNQQSEQLHRMERRMDEAGAGAKAADAKAKHLKSLNNFFFLPSFGAKKAAKREEELKRQKETQQFDNKYARERDAEWSKRSNRDVSSFEAPSRQYRTTPDGLERDEHEEEIDSNVSQISSGLSRLKAMGMAMNEELDVHSRQLDRLQQRTEYTRGRVDRLNSKVDQIVDKKR